MNDTAPVRIAGGPEIIARRPTVGTFSLLGDGVPLHRRSRLKSTYSLLMNDGSTEELQVMGQFTGLRVRVRGQTYLLERRLAPWEAILTWLPLALIAIGGLVGAVIALAGLGLNAKIVRRISNTPLRATALITVAVLAGGLWFATARAIVSPVAVMTPGTCLNGIREGAQVSASHAVECTASHDAEVVGTVIAPGTGAYPGRQALLAESGTPCAGRFAAYVGTDVASSTLTLLMVVPSDEGWAAGGRDVSCLVVASNGAPLTGSVLATGR